MFYGSTVEHRQGSTISDPYESRHGFSQFAEQLVWGTIFSSTTELRASIHL